MYAYEISGDGGRKNYPLNLNNALFVECCYCWQWDVLSQVRMDIHEIVFSRGSVMGGSDEAQLAIHDNRNCGWVHQEHCHSMAEGGDGRQRAIMYLIRYEGYLNVCKFALEMATLSPNFREAADINRAWETMLQRLRMVPFNK